MRSGVGLLSFGRVVAGTVLVGAALVAASWFGSAAVARADIGGAGQYKVTTDAIQLSIGTSGGARLGTTSLVSPMTITGEVDASGNFTASSATPISFFIEGIDQTISLIPLTPVTGTVSPGTGLLSLNMGVAVRLNAQNGPDSISCDSGTTSNPIQLSGSAALSTSASGTAFNPTADPLPANPFGGTALSASTGKFVIASNEFSMPAFEVTDTCPTMVADDLNNSAIGLPASAGVSAFALRGTVTQTGTPPPPVKPATSSVSIKPAQGTPLSVGSAKPSFNIAVDCKSSDAAQVVKCQGALSAKGEVKYTVRSRSGKLKRVTKRITVGYQPINQNSPDSKQYNFLLGPRSKELLQTAGKMRVTVSAYDTSTPARITNTTEIELKLKR